MTGIDYERIGEKVTELGLKFIRHERYAQLEEQFQILWHRRRAELKLGRACEARGIALVGLSGAGKTTAIDRLILSLNQKPDTDTIPVISLRIPSPATLKYVGQTLLKALKYDLKTERQAWYACRLPSGPVRSRKTWVMFNCISAVRHIAELLFRFQTSRFRFFCCLRATR